MLRTKDDILKVLADPSGMTGKHRNRYIIYRMLQALYLRQTDAEQGAKATLVNNGVGFNGYDSHFLSDVAEKSKPFENLSIKQAEAVAKRLKKYIRQLEEIMFEKLQKTHPVCEHCKGVGHTIQGCHILLANPQMSLLPTHVEP